MTCLIFQSLRYAAYVSWAFRFKSSKTTLDDMKAHRHVALVVAVSPVANSHAWHNNLSSLQYIFQFETTKRAFNNPSSFPVWERIDEGTCTVLRVSLVHSLRLIRFVTTSVWPELNCFSISQYSKYKITAFKYYCYHSSDKFQAKVRYLFILCVAYAYKHPENIWHSEDRASWYILIMKPTRSTISQIYLIKCSTCFGHVHCPSSGVSQHCICHSSSVGVC